ncbi:MAG: hypothetical protein ABR562_07285, partial [Thermoplasmatota archaeon]
MSAYSAEVEVRFIPEGAAQTRVELEHRGFEVHGEASGVVCVKVGAEGQARLIARRLPEAGLIANLVEFPAVPKNKARLRLQVMANHTEE